MSFYRFNSPTRPHPPLKPVKPQEYNEKYLDLASVLKLKVNDSMSLKKLVLLLGSNFIYDDILITAQEKDQLSSFFNFRILLRHFYKNENYIEQLSEYEENIGKYEDEVKRYQERLIEYDDKAKELDLEKMRFLQSEIDRIKQKYNIHE